MFLSISVLFLFWYLFDAYPLKEKSFSTHLCPAVLTFQNVWNMHAPAVRSERLLILLWYGHVCTSTLPFHRVCKSTKLS